MFIDEAVVELIAGSGGNGCLAFRREKYVAMGGPFGGNGGKGSDIIFKVDPGLNTLIDFKYKKIIKGQKGENGMGKGMHGKNAEDIIIPVPQGTVVTDYDTNLVIADLTKPNQQYIIAKGGRGGRGNMAFATQSNPAPHYAENGEPGEKIKIKIELKLMADVGLVGMPSVGKSTFISKISASKPKIADYPFTTLKPNLGVVKTSDNRSFVVADLPGLIEGASVGVGLGHEFLRHAMRTKILAHVIDMGASEGRDPIEDYKVIRKEIEEYNGSLKKKQEIVIANKMDLDSAQDNLEKFKKAYPNLEVIEISCMNNTGIDDLINILNEKLKEIPEVKLYNEADYKLYKFEDSAPYTITRDGDIWIVKGKEIETLLKMTRFEEDEGALRFARKFKGMGIEDELERMGAKPGDEVQILDYMFTFKDDNSQN